MMDYSTLAENQAQGRRGVALRDAVGRFADLTLPQVIGLGWGRCGDFAAAVIDHHHALSIEQVLW